MCKPSVANSPLESKRSKRSSHTTIIIGIVIFSYVLRNHADVILVLLPKYVDALFFHILYSAKRSQKNANKPIREPIVSKVPYYHEPLDDLNNIFDKDGYPRLVKEFAVVDHDKTVEFLYKRNKGRHMRMLDFGADVLDHFSPSCSRGFSVPRETAFDEYAENHLFSNKSSNHSGLYAGFESITDSDDVQKLLGRDLRNLGNGDYKQNNLFTSNFDKDLMSATLHCAPLDSVSIQLFGTKTWFFVGPQDLNNFQNVPFPTAFNVPMTDDELLSKIRNVHVAVQRPGDLVYFGPNWCHAVFTSKGPNLMFNLRYLTKEKLLRTLPFKQIFKSFFRKLTRSFAMVPQDNLVKFPYIYHDISNWMTDCGPSDALNRLIAKGKSLLYEE